MESYRLDNSLLKPAPFPKESEEIIKENKTIDLSLKNKSYPLKISLTDKNIIFFVQEKYSLYYYKNIFSYQEFQNLHKYRIPHTHVRGKFSTIFSILGGADMTKTP